MHERSRISQRMQEHYERFWSEGDPWRLESSELDADRYRRQAELLGDRRYARSLDIGCGSGLFTRRLADMCDAVTALDIAPAAIEMARSHCSDKRNVVFRAQNVMDIEAQADGRVDLIVMSETIYCLGWLYPLFDVGWLIHELHGAQPEGGRFLLVNTLGRETDYLLLPWLVKTYRDLFVNVGYALEHEEKLGGMKDGVQLDILMTLFRKA